MSEFVVEQPGLELDRSVDKNQRDRRNTRWVRSTSTYFTYM